MIRTCFGVCVYVSGSTVVDGSRTPPPLLLLIPLLILLSTTTNAATSVLDGSSAVVDARITVVKYLVVQW